MPTQEPATEVDGPRKAPDPATSTPAGSTETTAPQPADAGRSADPADAAPHFTTETGADKT